MSFIKGSLEILLLSLPDGLQRLPRPDVGDGVGALVGWPGQGGGGAGGALSVLYGGEWLQGVTENVKTTDQMSV